MGQTSMGQKIGEAKRIEERIVIDGKLDEPAWQKAPVMTDFIQSNPRPGAAPRFQTEVRVLYDDEALYVGAFMHDTSPDSILHQLTQRDEFGNTDYFGITLSCFRDGLNGFYFAITPDAVQLDVLLTVFGDDETWNAVWWAEAEINESGWVAEFKIPFAAFRFPRADEQEWDVNFERSIRRIRELSMWNEVNPEIDGFLNQSGILRGIRNIVPPPRLFFYPYASLYADRSPRPDGSLVNSGQWNAGMDVKYGLTDAYTLDMTLVPDFGQVQFDPFVLNLSPFEVRFNENRQFFQEGTELFNKGDLFYSRRIGGLPINYGRVWAELDDGEEMIDNPETSQLINATKISGRGRKGLGLGMFNAVTAPTYATVRDSTGFERAIQTAPLTNYSVLVADRNLNKNSYVTLLNTNVLRSGEDMDANVLGLEFQLRDNKNRYQVSGGGALNRKFGPQRFDGDNGQRYTLGLSKVSGQWRWGVSTNYLGADYDPTDLGFLFNNNERTHEGWLDWNRFKPKGLFNRIRLGTYAGIQQIVRPGAFYRAWVGVNGFAFDKNFHAYGFDAWINPTPLNDYFDTRIEGRHVIQPVNGRFGGWFSSDYRKVLALDANYYVRLFDSPDRVYHNIRFGPRWRVNDRLMLISDYRLDLQFMDFGFAFKENPETSIFGHRDVTTHTYSLMASYIFTNTMGISLRARHYWSKAEYDRFERLEMDGTTTLIDQSPFRKESGGTTRDISFNSYTLDLVFRWVFVPGSEVNVVWKNAIIDSSNEIPVSFEDNLTYTFGLPQANSLSIRVLYFLDYMTLKRMVTG